MLRRRSNFLSKSPKISFNSYSLVFERRMTSICGCSRLHDFPISIAVSSLSPVITHTRIFALSNCAIVYGTPSYNLSSIADAPTNSKFTSIFSAYSLISYSLSGLLPKLICNHLSSHSKYSLSVMVLIPITNVRYPSTANSKSCY